MSGITFVPTHPYTHNGLDSFHFKGGKENTEVAVVAFSLLKSNLSISGLIATSLLVIQHWLRTMGSSDANFAVKT